MGNLRSATSAGIVLVLALLWLVVLSSLVLIGLEINLMQTRMAANYQAKLYAFALAEKALNLAYSLVITNPGSGASGDGNSYYQITPFTLNQCVAQVCYQVIATGQYQKAKSVVQAVYLVIKQPSLNGVTTFEVRLISWHEVV